MYRNVKQLPDVTSQPDKNLNPRLPLEWVGMEKIGLPIKMVLSKGSHVTVNANADVFVSLDTSAKGIHMSRLYLKLKALLANQAVTLDSLNDLLDAMLRSHVGISESAKVRLVFDIPLKKKALLSENYGYQLYAVELTHQVQGGVIETNLNITIPYSSTCPCSSSLANQLNAESFADAFSEDVLNKSDVIEWLTSASSSLATPHNQRSYAYLKMTLAKGSWINIDDFVLQAEAAIGTPVQTAVKREDEQEFARLNGDNLMFCEDAARKVKGFLDAQSNISDYWFKVEHQESLHAHNAVVIDRKYKQ